MNPTSFPLHSQKRGDDIKFFKIDLSDAFVGAKKLCANKCTWQNVNSSKSIHQIWDAI